VRQNNLGRACGIGGLDRHAGGALRQRRVQAPFGRIAVELAAGSVAGGDPRHLEPRVIFKQLDEPLADHAGRAQNADW